MRAASVCVAAALLACPSMGTAKPAKEKKMAYTSLDLKQGLFRCDIPAGWGQARDEREEARTKVQGVHLIGPKEKGPLAPTLSLRYFASGNTVAQTADAYLKRQLEPGLVPLKGEKTSEPKKASAAGLAGFSFVRDTFEFIPPRSMDTKRIPVREEYVILERKEGFFVLLFKAPSASFKRWRPAFQRALDTFQPL
ncbi:MAG: hypothetical protein WC728_03000 [Elusimicrobiota bacterium]